MKRFPKLFSPDRRPDLTLPSMILAVGLLLAWAHSSARERGPFNLLPRISWSHVAPLGSH